MSTPTNTTTGAMASGSDPVAILAEALCRSAEPGKNPRKIVGFADPGPHIRLIDGYRRQAEVLWSRLAALAAPAPVVPEEVRRALEEARVERDNATRMLRAWFDTGSKATADLVPKFHEAMKGYLRTSRTGGMPYGVSETVEACLSDFIHRQASAIVTPVVEALAEERARTLLAATPSKPVGDRGRKPLPPGTQAKIDSLLALSGDDWAILRATEPALIREFGEMLKGVASAPPAGGGAVPAERWGIEEQDGFLWVGPTTPDGRVVNSYVFEMDLRDVGPSAYAANKSVALRVVAAMNAAAPAAPEPVAGGEREDATPIFDLLERQKSHLLDLERNLDDRGDIETVEFALARINIISAHVRALVEARSILSAPSGAETAGGDGAWPEHSPQEIVRRTRCMADETRDAVVWRDCCDLILERLGTPPKPTPANAGVEGGQHADR